MTVVIVVFYQDLSSQKKLFLDRQQATLQKKFALFLLCFPLIKEYNQWHEIIWTIIKTTTGKLLQADILP